MAAHSTSNSLPNQPAFETQDASPNSPPQPQPTRKPSRSRRHWAHLLAWIALGAILAFAVLLALFWPFTPEKVRSSIQEDWPGDVEIGSFHTQWFPHPGCVAESVKLSLRSGSQSIPIITIARGKVEARYSDFIFRPHFIARLVLEGLRVELPEEGKWKQLRGSSRQTETTSKPNQYAEILADNSSLTIARAPDHDSLVFAIHHLKLNDVRPDSAFAFEAAFRNPLPPGEIQASGKFGPWNSSNMSKTPVSGGYGFRDADLGVFDGIAGTLSSTGHFSGALGAIAVGGNIDIPNFEVVRSRHAVPLRAEYSAVVNGKNGDVSLRQVDAKLLETKIVANGAIARRKGKHGKFASLDLDIARGRINDVLRLFVRAPQPPMRGEGTFRAHVDIPPGPESFLTRVILDADFSVNDALFTNPERQKSIDDLSLRAQGKKPKDDNRAKNENAKGASENAKADTDPEPVRMELSSHLRIASAVAHFSELQATVPGAKANLSGNFGIRQENIDLHGSLKTQASLSKEASGIKSVLLKPLDPFFKKKKAGADVPVGITGTYSDPHFGLELPPKKPPAAPAPAEKKN